MRLTIQILGHTLDLSLEPTAAADEASSLDGGTTASYPAGFTVAYPVPEEIAAPQHCPSWDEPEE